MDIPTVEAWPREERGSRACRRLRRRGLVPAVMYGRDEPNVLLSLQEKELENLLRQHTLILQVQWDGQTTPVQIKEVQFDELGEQVLHADLGRISLDETVQVSVSVDTQGEAIGVREEGGVLEVILHEIQVECLPMEIPESIEADVSELAIGDDLRVRDLALPESIEAVPDPSTVVVTCVPPMEMVSEEEEEELAEEFMAEPEVIGAEEEEEELPPEEEEEVVEE